MITNQRAKRFWIVGILILVSLSLLVAAEAITSYAVWRKNTKIQNNKVTVQNLEIDIKDLQDTQLTTLTVDENIPRLATAPTIADYSDAVEYREAGTFAGGQFKIVRDTSEVYCAIDASPSNAFWATGADNVFVLMYDITVVESPVLTSWDGSVSLPNASGIGTVCNVVGDAKQEVFYDFFIFCVDSTLGSGYQVGFDLNVTASFSQPEIALGEKDIELSYVIEDDDDPSTPNITYSLDNNKLKECLKMPSSETIDKVVDTSDVELTSVAYGEEKKIIVKTNQHKSYKVDALFVSLIINNAADLDEMGNILNASKIADGRIRLKSGATSSTGGVQRNFVDGYFVLGNDIDYNNGIYTNAPAMCLTMQGSAIYAGFSSDKRGGYNRGSQAYGYGFEGVFDGRGHTIYNMNLTAADLANVNAADPEKDVPDPGSTSGAYAAYKTGLFTAIAGSGVIQNVAFQINKMGNFGTNGSAGSPSRYFGGLAYEVYGTVENVSFVIKEVAFHDFSGIVSLQSTVGSATKLRNISVYAESYTKYNTGIRAGIIIGHALSAVDSDFIYYVQGDEMKTSGSGTILSSTWNQNGGTPSPNEPSLDANFVPSRTPARKVHRYNSIADFSSGTSVTYSLSVPTYVEYTAMPLISDFGEYWATSDGDFDYTYGVMLFESTKKLLETAKIPNSVLAVYGA